ncbi:MAG: hypothetical protein DI526_06705 [Caulobacter segnis]|uniref:Organic solvent tolerance-like N-terminal domain-containing protein n=2 Tax=Caulobacter segnis TaxID=88688 RepID=A0A2W5VAI4_9CAUL|nr:MAG: hypothetical protein DI526_06705 [Caulobacter segnis]
MVLMKRWTAAAATALVLSGLGPVAAHAQQGDSSAPIDVAADYQETINSKCIIIFRGNVEILQDRSRLRARQVTVYNAKRAGSESGCGNAQRLEAEGDVYVVSENQKARGDRAVYTYSDSTAVLTGDVILTRGKDVARGDRLTVNTKTNDAKLESTAKGRSAPRRVRAVFYQEDSKKSDTPAVADQPAQR